MKKTFLAVFAVLFCLVGIPFSALHASPSYNGAPGDVMLQAFYWKSADEKENLTGKDWYVHLDSIKDQIANYFSVVYMNPPSASAAKEGYMPGDWSNLTSDYGTALQLRNLISWMQSKGKKVIADIVVNHRSAKSQCPHGMWCVYDYSQFAMGKENFIHGPWDTVNEEGHQSCGTCMTSGASEGSWSWNGNTYANEDFGGSPDLNHWFNGTRDVVKNWLRWLQNPQNAGFDGWRWDMIGGFSPQYLGEYNDHAKPYLSVGEKPTGNTQMLYDMINRSGNKTMVFDFPLRDALHSALSNNQMRGDWLASSTGANKNYGVMGGWPGAAVTFVNNHDIDAIGNHFTVGRLDMHWGKDARGVTTQAAYAFILTHPGIPCVFYSDWKNRGTDLENAINALILIRKRNNVKRNSRVWVAERRDGLYAAYIGDANNEQVAIKIGKTGLKVYEDWKPAASLGLGYAYTRYDSAGHAYCVYYKNRASYNLRPVLMLQPTVWWKNFKVEFK